MPDNNLRIGATVDKGELEAGFTSVQDLTQKVTQRLAVSFEEASSRSRTAMRGLSDDVKIAAENISDETLRIAEATRAQSAAYADLARARVIARDTNIAPEISTPILGAAQEGVIKTSQELAAAKQAEANAVVAAAEREALAGQKVTAEALRTAAAVRQQAAAQAELARVQSLVANGELEAAEADQFMAAATVRLGAASKEVIAAKQAEAAAVARAAEEEALSQNVVIRAFQRMAISARESLESVQEKLVETAEASRLEAGGIGGAFAGLSGLLGAGLAVGFAAHFIDELDDMQIALGHVAAQTDIDVASLAGLQQTVRSMGVEWEPVERGLVRLLKAQQLAKEGSIDHANAQVKAFERIGISFQELQTLKPEDLLNRVSGAIAGMKDPSAVAATAIALFGRGGAALIPIFKELGPTLSEHIAKVGDTTGVTKESVAAAESWKRSTEAAGNYFRSVLIPVLSHAEPIIRSVALVFEGFATVIITAFEAVATALTSLFSGLKGLALIFRDAVTGNFAGMLSDAIGAKDSFVKVWADGISEIKKNFAELAGDRDKIHWNAPEIPRAVAPDSEDLIGDQGDKHPKGRGAGHAALHRDEDQLNAIKLDHQVTLEEEIRFWQEKLATAKKGSEEYRDIVARLAPLTQREDRKKKPDLEPENPTQTGEFKEYVQQWEQQQTAMLRFDEESYKQDIEAARLALDEKMRIAQEDGRNAIQDAQQALSTKEITKAEEIQLEIAAANQQFQVERQVIQQKERLDLSSTVAYQRDLNRELELTRQHARQMEVLNRQAAQQSGAAWEQAFTKMQEDMNVMLLSMFQGHRKLEQQLATVWNGIVENFAKNILKMTEQFLIGILTQKAGQKSVILGDAKTAAANTYASVSAIPVVGPFLAPPAAAAAFAAVLAFDSFNEGGMVTKGGGMHIPVLAKAGERVLSTSQTDNFHSLVNNSSRGGNTVNNHLHYEPQINAYDRSGFRNQLRGHSDDIADLMRGVLRPEAFA